MQVNVAGLRRNIKNLAHNYSDAQVKVREATSNDPWGPSATIMAEIADLTYNVVAFSEIMQMIWKRLNDHGKNWRHVYKALILLEYLIKTGSEKVAQQCKENIFAIQTLREFVYFEEGKDQGTHVREKAKQLVNLLKDDERLKNERVKALKAKERFAQHPSGFGSDGYIDGPSHRDMPPGWQEEPKPVSELEMVRPQTAGEEELQLQLAMAMSREEAEQEEAKRRSDDVRLQLALSQSEQDFKQPGSKKEEPQSHLLDLLDISLGATSISSPPLGAAGGVAADPWGTPARAASQLSDPWSGTSSPPIDPWHPTANMRSNTTPAPLGAAGGMGAAGTNGDAWALRTQSPSVASGSSTEGWLHSNGGAAGMNGNAAAGAPVDPWLSKASVNPLSAAAPMATNNTTLDPWLNDSVKPAAPAPVVEKTSDDPWAPKTLNDDPWKSIEIAGTKKPSPDMDEFDIITNRNKTGDLLSNNLTSGPNNNNASLLDDLDPLSAINTATTTNAKKPLKTPQAFLGENSSLVNLDNLIKPIQTQTQPGSAAYNPFSDTVIPPKTNLFQQQQPAVPSINQLKQQQPFAMSMNQDPWAPVAIASMASQKPPKTNDCCLINYDSDESTTSESQTRSSNIYTTTATLHYNNTNDSLTNNNNNNNSYNNNNTSNYNYHFNDSNKQNTTTTPNLYPVSYSKSDFDVFSTSHVQNELSALNAYNTSFHSSNYSQSVDNIRNMQITPNTNTNAATNGVSETIKPSDNFNYYPPPNYLNPNSPTGNAIASQYSSPYQFHTIAPKASLSASPTAALPTVAKSSYINNNNNNYSSYTTHAVDNNNTPLYAANNSYSHALSASLATTPGIRIAPMNAADAAAAPAANAFGGLGGGSGSLFSYGFYDENAPNTLSLGNCKMENNNNNNNMPWINAEAAGAASNASSNPFLS